MSPEESQNPRFNPVGGEGDNIIAIASEASETFGKSTGSTFEAAVAFSINHGAGHLSNLNHANDANGYDDQGDYRFNDIDVPQGLNVMNSAQSIVDGKLPLSTYITSPINKQPANAKTLCIQKAYIHRFSADAPIPRLPTY